MIVDEIPTTHPTTAPAADRAARAAALAAEIEALVRAQYGPETRALVEDHLCEWIAERADLDDVRVGVIETWWPFTSHCMALATLKARDEPDDDPPSEWLLAQVDADDLLDALGPDDVDRAVRWLPLERGHLPLLRTILGRMEGWPANPAETGRDRGPAGP
jgi:hypothetical protein